MTVRIVMAIVAGALLTVSWKELKLVCGDVTLRKA